MISAFIFHPPHPTPCGGHRTLERWVKETGVPLPSRDSNPSSGEAPPAIPRSATWGRRHGAGACEAARGGLRSVSASLCVCVSVLVWTTQGGGCPSGMGAGQRAWGAPPTIRALMDGGDGRVCISACARCNPRSLLGDPFWIRVAQSFGLLFLSFLYL